MGAFEYLSVLISIVLGLGITHLLLGFGRWLERRGELEAYGPAMAWGAFLLLLHVQTWWSMFGYRAYDEWDFLQFSVVLLQPVVLFLLAVVVFPGPSAPHQDLRENFVRQRPWFFGLLIVLLAVSVVKELVRDRSLPEPLNLAFHVTFLVMAVVGRAVERERVQRGLAYSALAIFMGYITVLFADL